MGWNQGYTTFEAMVIAAYDLGKLDKAMLTLLMEPYRGTDIDSGGGRNLRTKDGKDLEQVVIETWGLEYPARPENADDDPSDEYGERLFDLFTSVTDHFGWE